MRMRNIVVLLVCSLAIAADVAAQSGGAGSLRGTVVDEQGAAMPGVTVTATSPAAISPGTDVTDGAGEYRLANLPPGTYLVTAELPGFATYRREGIIVRAGLNFQLEEIAMKVGTLEEAITVSGRSPMIEVTNPTTTLNMDADFQKALPLVESKFWSDFLQMTPGVLSRPHNDGSGRQNYFSQGVEHREHVTQMEGLMAGNYNDMNINRTGLSTEAIADTNVKTGGVDAAAPMGYGLVINMVSKSGGNTFSGSSAYNFQPYSWNGNNAEVVNGVRGTSVQRKVNQFDFAIGGPIKRDRTWFFGAFRVSRNETTPSRTPADVGNLRTFAPELGELPTNVLYTNNPWLKITHKLTPNHDLVGIYQADRLKNSTAGSTNTERFGHTDTGGLMLGFNLRSVWGPSVTTTFSGNYNNKGGNSRDSFDERLNNAGPRWSLHQTATVNADGTVSGSGGLISGGGQGSLDLDAAGFTMVRGDVTWFKSGWGGSHEFQTGFLALPRSHYEQDTVYLNDGFTAETRRMINPNNPAAGAIAFQRTIQTGSLDFQSGSGVDRDYGMYVQDTWRPIPRLTMTLGVRADFVRKFAPILDVEVQRSREIGPRFGGSYLVTDDARNVVRASFARVHRQMMGGRDPVSEFQGSPVESSRTEYDANGDGIFETAILSPARPTSVLRQQFAPDFQQPYIDETIIGFQRQFPLDISLDVAGTWKTYHGQYSQVDINGRYPDGPSKPFGGFGLVDPNSGTVFKVTNNTWADTKYSGVIISVAKNMSRNFQILTSIHRQWQHLEPTGDPISPLGWNPTDPARFIQPDAYPNNRNIWRAQGLTDQNSLSTGNALINNPIWAPGSFRLAGTWQAPYGLIVSSNWTAVAGPWTGPIINQLAANDPALAVFGPASFRVGNGTNQTNPLATRIRFLYPTRSEGQEAGDVVHTVGFKLGKNFRMGGARELQVGFNSFNVLNAGGYTEWNRSGANRYYSPTVYLTKENRQPSRSYQVDATVKF